MRPNGTCRDCGAPVRFVHLIPNDWSSVEQGSRRTSIPMDLDYDPATSDTRPSHAMNFARTAARACTRDEPPAEHEVPGLTHFATCPSRRPMEAPDARTNAVRSRSA